MPSAAEAARKTTARQEEPRKKAAEEQAAEEQPEKGGQVVHMHTAHPTLPVPYLTPGDVKANVQVMTSGLPSARPAKELLFYGGLGALAVVGALEWPVALAIGGATLIVRGRRKEEAKEPQKSEEADSGRSVKKEEAEKAKA